MDIDKFLDLFRKSLNLVEESYYQTNSGSLYTNTIMYYERVFCYELYHQVRSLMYELRAKDPSTLSSIQFQGELRKEMINSSIAAQTGLSPLSKKYVPDFLLHSPGSTDYHGLIIEVKSNRNICFEPIQKDLVKIQEFITQYKYQMGIFLIINNSKDRMRKLIAKPKSQEWIRANLPDRCRILFMSKENNWEKPFECYLDNVPEYRS
jgi:hypothetical protein